MRKELLALMLLMCARLATAESLQTIFRDCMGKQGPEYLHSVSNLAVKIDAKLFLESIAASKDMGQADRRMVAILLARMERPALFADLVKCIADVRRSPNYGRGGYFGGSLLQFTSTGPESKFVWEAGEMETTPHGAEHKYKKVEKYTDEEVTAGKARNATARLAVVEYFLKFSQDFNDYYEMPEMLHTLKVLEEGRGWLGVTKRPDVGIPTRDLIEEVLKDEKRPLPVRVAAACELPEGKIDKVAVAELMVKTLRDDSLDDDRKYRATAEVATQFLKLYGDRQDLSALKTNEPHAQWKRELVEKTVKEITARTSENPQGTVP